MKFIVVAQLPKSLALLLKAKGYDTIHTLDLTDQNATSDVLIYNLSAEEGRIVITKDTDFLHAHLILNKPKQLILVKTGNIRNNQLLQLFESNLGHLLEGLTRHSLVEIHQNEIIFHSS